MEKNKQASAIEVIKNAMKLLMGKTEEVKMASATLDSGDEISFDGDWAEGTAVYDADGNPLPDGDYTLDNGDTFTVTDGVISAINADEDMEAKEEAAEDAPAEDAPADEKTDDSDVSARLDKIEETINAILEVMGYAAEFSKNADAQIAELKMKVEKIEAEPAGKPLNKQPKEKVTNSKNSKLIDYNTLVEAMAKLKNKNK